MKYCSVCGKEIPDSSRFCMYCGSDISNPSQASKQEPTDVIYYVVYRTFYDEKVEWFRIKAKEPLFSKIKQQLDSCAENTLKPYYYSDYLSRCEAQLNLGLMSLTFSKYAYVVHEKFVNILNDLGYSLNLIYILPASSSTGTYGEKLSYECKR
jgi:hypothetical protein